MIHLIEQTVGANETGCDFGVHVHTLAQKEDSKVSEVSKFQRLNGKTLRHGFARMDTDDQEAKSVGRECLQMLNTSVEA
jgi:hypothetical protein